MKLTTISSKRQITLPKRLGDQLSLRPGVRLSLAIEGDRLVHCRFTHSIVAETAGSLRQYVTTDKLARPWEEIIAETKRLAAAELAREGVPEAV